VAGYGGLLHGEAVAIGLVAALWLSERVRGLSPALREEMTALLTAHGLPVRADGVEAGAVLEAMRHDKKRAAGTHRFVLLDAPGAPVYGCEVPDALVAEAVERVT
jgi:3-dehydroquinate synthase